MKKIGLISLLVLCLAVPCFAQWGGGINSGTTVTHRSALGTADVWWASNPAQPTSSSLELRGYNKVRADYDVTPATVSIVGNLQCSNDSIWVSGDSVTVTRDSSDTFDLMGCEDYTFYVESMTAGSTITVYLTPYSK